MKTKIKNLKALKDTTARLHEDGKKIVFTNGCFDILHRGHIEYLKKAKKLGDILIVGVNSDSSVKKLKGPDRPVNKEKDRAAVLSSLEAVDYITIFTQDTPYDLIKAVRPDVLVKGGDWKIKDIVGADFVRSYGGRVAVIPYIKGYSTSALLKKIE